MSSILKILSDVDCQVYCDYELKGDVIPGKIFRIEMRKGNYVLEFKRDDVVLLSKEYEMCSNDEERLLKVSLSEVVANIQKEKQFEEIAALNIVVSRNYEGNTDEVFLKSKDTHEKTLIPYNVSETAGFDECGLLAVNVEGVAVDELVPGPGWDFFRRYEGGQWGCIDKLGNIQIPIIYDKPIYFFNQNVAVAQLNGKKIIINKWGESIYSDLYDNIYDKCPYYDNYCIVTKDFKYALIDDNGKYILSPEYSSIERSKKRSFFIKKNGRLGIFLKGGISDIYKLLGYIDSFEQEGNVYYFNKYENILLYDYYIVAIQSGKKKIFDYEGNLILGNNYDLVPAFYQMRNLYSETYSAQIVAQNGKYGCLNKNVIEALNTNGGLPDIQMVVPCEYDYVAKYDYSFLDIAELSNEQPDEQVEYFVKKEPLGDYHYYHYHIKNETAILVDDGIHPHPASHYLFIDTETTGLLPTKHYEKYEDYLIDAPYLVQVALLLCDKNLNKLSEKNMIVKPQGYSIPIESSKIHGITNSYAIEKGEARQIVMEYLKRVYDTVNVIVGHNLDFDLTVIDDELYREDNLGCGYHYKEYDDGSFTFTNYKADSLIDTMKLGADVCKIPSAIKGEKYKWPTLDELYRKLFGKSFQGQHNAMNDVSAMYECYCKMIGKNI